MGPCQVTELDFFENFRIIFASLDIPEMNFGPVGSGFREAVGKDWPVFAEAGGREGDRSVLGQEVGIEEHRRLARQRILNVDDAENN